MKERAVDCRIDPPHRAAQDGADRDIPCDHADDLMCISAAFLLDDHFRLQEQCRNLCPTGNVVSRPNPFFELLFGGNMLEGTFKAVIWVALLAAVLAWTTFR